jgi:malate dehydrogenase (oxaloacetate-decarboxylating)
MDEENVFANEAADVAEQAVREGVAAQPLTRDEVFARTAADIRATRDLCHRMMSDGSINPPPRELIETALKHTRELLGK